MSWVKESQASHTCTRFSSQLTLHFLSLTPTNSGVCTEKRLKNVLSRNLLTFLVFLNIQSSALLKHMQIPCAVLFIYQVMQNVEQQALIYFLPQGEPWTIREHSSSPILSSAIALSSIFISTLPFNLNSLWAILPLNDLWPLGDADAELPSQLIISY